jgi:hypothetical protein
MVSSWQEAYDVHEASVTTISARLPIIAAAASGWGGRDAHIETQEMVAEKLKAAAEGAKAGAWASAHVGLKVFWGEALPMAMAGHIMDVADAATRPARSKVRANARRLGPVTA